MMFFKSRKSTTKKPTFLKALLQKIKKIVIYLLLFIFVLPVVYIFLLNYINPPLTPLMVQRFIQGYGYEHRWLELEALPRSLRYAAIAAEDNKFCGHHGFDFKALRYVMADALKGKRTAGASTISMQTSKNLLLLPNRSFIRKLFEAYYTIWLEMLLDKKELWKSI